MEVNVDALKELLKLVQDYTDAEVKEDLEAAKNKQELEKLTADNAEANALVAQLKEALEKLKNSAPVDPTTPEQPVPQPVV